MFFSRPAGHKYFDRGDPSSEDFDETDLNVELSWTDIDLSGIVPAGAVAVLLAVMLNTVEANATMQLRKNGNSNFIEGDGLTVQVANQSVRSHFWLACDTARKIEYYLSPATWSTINVTVKAWIK